ncbi:unnamed protein product [Oppiella nova]|uniref:Cadherin Y-type LIR-motif domain-containing protein n=1 Tax=Oppiella nova TaxID=334625 RepID=A0A7R9QN43_9ACAR|nr:unnamed protein product [Oppiella nova]CAG2168302.1 unnamed protein product [Oppiella nova]
MNDQSIDPDGKLDINDNGTWRTNSFRSDTSTVNPAESEHDKPVQVKDVYYRQTFPVVQHQDSADYSAPVETTTLDPQVGHIIKNNLEQMAAHHEQFDGPADDDLRGYSYEGGGSTISSLSSLGSGFSDGEQDFEYTLSRLGPRFAALADIYSDGSYS